MDTFPLCSFPPSERRLMLAGMVADSGPALVGPGQSIDWSAGGWWVLVLGGMHLRTVTQRKLWNAMMMRLGGGSTEIIVPLPFGELAPWAPGQSPGPVLTTHSDDSTFDDGAEYSQSGLSYVLDGAIEDGATAARVRRLAGGDIVGGEPFTLVHEDTGPRAYMIESVQPVEGEADLFDIEFGPPTRGSADDEAVVDFDNVRSVMTIANAAEAWPTRQHRTPTPAQATFVESFQYLNPTE